MTHYPITRERPSFSLPAILAIVCAIVSFFVGAGFGFILAIAAIVLGLIGVVLALAPSVRGGITSILAILAGIVGIVAALFRLVL